MKKINVFDRKTPELPRVTPREPFHELDIPDRAITQRVIDGLIIDTGVAAKRPSGSTHTKAYFSTDTFVLSIWTGSAWKSVTLS